MAKYTTSMDCVQGLTLSTVPSSGTSDIDSRTSTSVTGHDVNLCSNLPRRASEIQYKILYIQKVLSQWASKMQFSLAPQL